MASDTGTETDDVRNTVPGVEQLMLHIDDLYEGNVNEFDERLFDTVNLLVTNENRQALFDTILVKLVEVVRQAVEKQQDFSCALPLIIKLLRFTTFEQVLEICDAREIEWGLSFNAVPALQELMLEIVHKASKSAEDCVKLAEMDGPLQETIYTMFHAKDVRIGMRVVDVLRDLLARDWTHKPPQWNIPQGEGRIWEFIWVSERMRRIFHTSLYIERMDKESQAEDQTTAQARTLELVWHCAAMEPMLILTHPAFEFFTCEMVQTDDQPMCAVLAQFWVKCILQVHASPRRNQEVDEELGRRLKMSMARYRMIGRTLRGLPGSSHGLRADNPEHIAVQAYIERILLR